MPLLTRTQQNSIKKISSNYVEADYNELALEVQEKELKDLLGIALYQDVRDNPTSATNVKLLDGTTFEDRNGNDIETKGLRWMLAYMNYSKYLGVSQVADTFSGFVQKTRPDAEALGEGAIKRLQNDNRQLALGEWDVVKEYLDLNSSDYPLWRCAESRKPYLPKFTGIRKTTSQRKVYIDQVTRTIIK